MRLPFNALKPLMRSSSTAAALALLPIALQTQAQPQQKISGPQARYWVDATTGSGMGMGAGGAPSMGAMLGGMLGGGGGGGGVSNSFNKTMHLELGAVRDNNPATGLHVFPASTNLSQGLPLLGVKRETRGQDRDFPELPDEDMKMRMLFFWGCGDNAPAGQPFIMNLDTKEMKAGRLPATASSFRVNTGANGPAPGRDRGYADWPNGKDIVDIPPSASLVGDHEISSNISPTIRFSVAVANDFLDPLTMTSSKLPTGGLRLSWNAVERSLGYAATAMGMRQTESKTGDLVIWNSSAKQMFSGDPLMLFLPPAEVNRLVNERVMLSPNTTECIIPKQVVDAAGGQILNSNLTAHGPELNVIHPPRPSDARVDWKQEYAVKVRTRSQTTILPIMGDMMGGGRAPQPESAPSEERPSRERGISPGGLIRGLFGL